MLSFREKKNGLKSSLDANEFAVGKGSRVVLWPPLSKIEHTSAFLYWEEGPIKHFNLLLLRLYAKAQENKGYLESLFIWFWTHLLSKLTL